MTSKRHHYCISSFHHQWLRQIQLTAPHIKIQALIGLSFTAPLDWGDYAFDTDNARSTLIDESEVKRAKAKGKTTNLFTVNTIKDMQRFMSWSVDGIITDYPQRLKTLALPHLLSSRQTILQVKE